MHFAVIKVEYQKYEGGKAVGSQASFGWNAASNQKT